MYHKRVGVVNLGLAAFGTEQSLIALRRYAALLGRPSVCLYLGSDNDWDDDRLFRSGYRHRHLVAGSPHWGWLVTPLQWVAASQVALRVKLAVSKVQRARILARDGEQRDAGGRPVAEIERPGIEKIVAACGDYGARLVLSWAQPSPSYEWLKIYARSRGIAFADWVPAVESMRSAIPSLPLYNQHSAGHLRGWVNRLIAEEFARQIEGHGRQRAPLSGGDAGTPRRAKEQ